MKRQWYFRLGGLAILFWLALPGVSGQGWKRTFPGHGYPQAIRITPDGGAVFIASLPAAPGLDRDMALIKADPLGQIQWQRSFGGPGDDLAWQLELTPDGGVVVAGQYAYDPDNGDLLLTKYTLGGDLLWTGNYSPGALDIYDACSVRVLADGSLIAAVDAFEQLRLLKTDSAGQQLWEHDYPQTQGLELCHLELLPDGYLLTMIRPASFLTNPEAHLLKIDTAGELRFERVFPSTGLTNNSRARALLQDDSHYLLLHRDTVYRLDTAGQVLQAMPISAPAGELLPADLATASDGGFYVLGTAITPSPGQLSRLFFARFDALGVPVWTRFQQAPTNYHQAFALEKMPDQGFLLSGHYLDQPGGQLFTYLLRTDSTGRSFTNQIHGQIRWDQNEDCSADVDELPLSGWIVRVDHPNGEIYYTTVDSSGAYQAEAGVGEYTVSVQLPNHLWASPCVQQAPVSFDTSFLAAALDFPIRAGPLCPLPWVDLGAADWQPCLEQGVAVRFANHGTATLPGATIDLQIDSLLTVAGTSLAYTQTAPFTYRFALGDLPALSAGQFTVQLVPDCNGTIPAQSRCITARILPEPACLAPVTGPWIDVRGRCEGDSVRFVIRNIGGGGMSESQKFIIIEDDIMVFMDSYQLPAGAEKPIAVPANGSTWRLQTPQDAALPDWRGDAQVAAAVEGCPGTGAFSTGFLNQFSLYDGSNFYETECRSVVTQLAGNEKRGYPLGFDDAHYIQPNTDLEYVLSFQNTGSMPVTLITLRDTLDPLVFDPATVEPGASSHPYTFSLSDLGVVTFSFDSVFLPGPTMMGPAGGGWVKFRVVQRPDLPPGTLIHNRAGIYLDYQAPQWSNASWHTVTLSLLAPPPPPPPLARVRTFPVPALREVMLETTSDGHHQAIVTDLSGRLLLEKSFTGRQLVIADHELPPGLFLATVKSGGTVMGTVKIIKLN